MHPFQLAILAMAPTDWTRDGSRHERRIVTAEERDALADGAGARRVSWASWRPARRRCGGTGGHARRRRCAPAARRGGHAW